MTQEQLTKAQKLNDRLTFLQKELSIWKAAKGFRLNPSFYCENDTNNVESNLIDFNLLKLVTIARIEKEITEIETQFAAL